MSANTTNVDLKVGDTIRCSAGADYLKTKSTLLRWGIRIKVVERNQKEAFVVLRIEEVRENGQI